MNEPGRRIDFLDHIRGIAIFSVFLFHSLVWVFHRSSLPWNGWFPDLSVPGSFLAVLPASLGWAGVAIFFVVSGFCIHFSFLQHGRDWRGFFVRRFFRIYPPYFFAVLLCGMFIHVSRAVLVGGTFLYASPVNFSFRLDWYQLIMHLLLIHNFNPYSFYAISSSFWSIAVEIQLYLLYPVLLMLVSKLGWRRALILIAAIEIVIRGIQGLVSAVYGIDGTEDLGGQQFYLRFFYFLAATPLACWFSWSLGAVIADAFLGKRALPLAKSSLSLWLVLAVGSYFVRPLEPFSFLLFAVLTATAISKLLSGARPRIPLPGVCLKYLQLTGTWSYSIYLLHQSLIAVFLSGFIAVCPRMTHPLAQFGICVISWFAIMPVCGLWYYCLEAPGIRLGKRIIQGKLLKRQIA